MVQAVAAIPLVGSIASATGLAATTVASIALYTATTAASYFLQQAMAPDAPKQETGTKLRTVLGGAVTLSFIFGQQETAGSFIYKGTWGRSAAAVPNAFLVKVYALSDLPVNGFADWMWAGGRKCSISSGMDTIDGLNVGHPVPAFNRNGTRLWVKFHDGTQTVADPYLRAKFGDDPKRPWTADMIGRGRAYAIVTQKYDKKEPAGEVDPIFVVNGAKLYDWRLDSTNGGSGSHRYGTRSTYAFNSNNPIVAIYNIMRGIYHDDEWMYGGQGWPATRFDNDSFTAAANVCDDDVALANGGTQKRYRVGGEIDLSEEPWTVIERLLKACNGRIVESGGVFKVYAGGIGASVFSFTDDDVLVSEALSGSFFPARDEIANTIVGSYVEPDNAGEAKAYRSRSSVAYIAEDGGEVRKQSFDLEYVRDNRRAQWLAKLALNDNRRFRTFVVAFWTAARKLEPCDVVSWTSERFGFTNKKFIVGDVTLRDDGVVIANLREADANDANWSTADEEAYSVGVFEEIEVATPAPVITVEPWTVKNNNGVNKKPALRIAWSLDDDEPGIKRLEWEARLATTLDIADQGSANADKLEDFAVKGIIRAETYEARARYIYEDDRESDWSDWTGATAPDVRLADEDIQLPELEGYFNDRIDEETEARVADAFAAAEDRRSLLDRVESLSELTSEGIFQAYSQKEELRTEVVATQNADRASFTSQITAVVADNAAAVARIDTLEADTSTLGASITAVDQARVEGEEAVAEQIAALSSGTQNQFDHAAIWYFDAGVEGWTGNGAPTMEGRFLRPANATDPYVISPEGLGVDGAKYTQVRMRIKKIGSPVWAGGLYWKAGADATWDAGRLDAIEEPVYDPNGFGLVTVNSDWAGTVNQIRIDLSTVQDAVNYFLIDWVAIGRPSPGASSAELATERQARIDADSANASDITVLESRINDPVTGLDAVSSAVGTLETSVSTLDGIVSAQGTAITGLETEVDGKADSSAIDFLQTQIDDFGSTAGLSSIGSSIRALRNTVDPLAELAAEGQFQAYLRDQDVRQAVANASQTLSTRIDVTEESIDIVAEAVTAVEAALPGLASATGLTALESRVSVTEGAVTSISSDMTTLESEVDGKASASALSALTTEVSDIDGVVATIANAVTSLTAGDEAGNVASARVQFSAVGGPTGWARYAVQIRSASGAAFVDAGFYLEVQVSTGISRIVLKASKVYITDDLDSLATAPFKVEGGNVYINNALVTTESLAPQSVEAHASHNYGSDTEQWNEVSGDRSRGPTSMGTTDAIQNTNPSAVIVHVKFTITAGVNSGTASGGSADRMVRLRIYSEKTDGSDSNMIFSEQVTASATYNNGVKSDSVSRDIEEFLVDVYTSPANRRYKATVEHILDQNSQAANVTSGGSVQNVQIKLIWWKR